MKTEKILSVILSAAAGSSIIWMIAYAAGFQDWKTALFAITVGTITGFVLVGPKEILVKLLTLPKQIKDNLKVWYTRSMKRAGGVTQTTAYLPKKTFSNLKSWFSKPENVRGIIQGIIVFAGVIVVYTLFYAQVHAIAFLMNTLVMPHLNETVTIFSVFTVKNHWILAVIHMIPVLVVGIIVSGYLVQLAVGSFRRHKHSMTRFIYTRGRRSAKVWFRKHENLSFGLALLLWPVLILFFLATTPVLVLILMIEMVRVVFTSIVNTFMSLAVSRRIAAAQGAAIGGGVTLSLYWGSTQFLVPLLLSMVIGGIAGGIIFWVREVVFVRTGKTTFSF